MSLALDHQTVRQRASAATTHLRRLLDADNLTLLSAAVAEAAAEEVHRNPTFRSTVRRIYEQLSTLDRSKSARRRTANTINAGLEPLPGAEGTRFDPFAPLDPYLLLRLYGPRQLRAALSGYSHSALREAASAVRARHAGTKPKDGRKAESLIDYIVEHLSGS